jgi:hypothetical protein
MKKIVLSVSIILSAILGVSQDVFIQPGTTVNISAGTSLTIGND